MNNMEKVAEILGVKLGEKFKVNGAECYVGKEGLTDDGDHQWDRMLIRLLIGEYTIEKLPRKPKIDDKYWFVTMDGNIDSYYWDNDDFDHATYYAGNCFETREEALAHAPEIIAKLRKKYEE